MIAVASKSAPLAAVAALPVTLPAAAPKDKTLAQQKTDFTSEGSPAPGDAQATPAAGAGAGHRKA
jgi:hypothetical protein